jgi:hypothetical protein
VTDIADLRPLVAVQAANCPNPVIDAAVVDAARALCNAAPVWRDSVTFTPGDDETTTTIGETLYGVEKALFESSLPDAYTVIRSLRAERSDEDYAEGEMVRVIPPWLTTGDDEAPFRAYKMTAQNEVKILRDPGVTIMAHIAVRPVIGATTLPEIVGGDYREAIIAGALTRVLRQAANPWANPDMAVYYEREFRRHRADAIAAANRGFVQTGIRARAPVFARFAGGRP